jgi:toxin-antitoxin system PIN domain toxin
MRSLLDINVLIALIDPDHAFHQRAHDWWGKGDVAWASCPLTENGLIRIMTSPAYCKTRPFTVAELSETFSAFVEATDHEFWPDSISVIDVQRFQHDRILSPKLITDLYLLALAVENGGRLVTFDQKIPRSAVSQANPGNMLVL